MHARALCCTRALVRIHVCAQLALGSLSHLCIVLPCMHSCFNNSYCCYFGSSHCFLYSGAALLLLVPDVTLTLLQLFCHPQKHTVGTPVGIPYCGINHRITHVSKYKTALLTVGGCSGNCSLPLGGEFLNLGLSPGIRCNVEGGQGEAGGLHLASGH